MSQYIPDLTERFPEGYYGADRTNSYFYDPGYMDDYDPADFEECENEYTTEKERVLKKNCVFEVGKYYSKENFYCGGMTNYRVISKKDDKITLAESDWVALMDGVEERNAEEYTVETDENGNEYVEFWYDEDLAYHARIRANVPDGFNPLIEEDEGNA